MYREQQIAALLQGRNILIAGYGREGHSIEQLLQRLPSVPRYTIADGDQQIVAEATKPYDLVLKSPGVPMRLLGAATPHVSSLTDVFLQVYADHVVGITGTKGKSTTASLIHHLLPGSLLAGNIGIPLFDIIDRMEEGSLVVAELSCHQLELLHRSPHVAVLLNLYQEHLDHYDNYHGYQMAKMQIGLHQTPTDSLYYCTDNDELRALVEQLPMPGMLHPYSLCSASPEEERLLEACPLEGAHNRSNALVACRVAARVLGVAIGDLRSRLATFQGLRHRMERVGEHRGIVWYDDSISTIPAATIAAVQSLSHVDTLIVGGFDRGIDYAPLAAFLSEWQVDNMVFVGQAGRRLLAMMPQWVDSPSVLVEDDYTKIVPWCATHTPRGGVVLLSPAAASYDAFKNFEQRGDFYRQQIMMLHD